MYIRFSFCWRGKRNGGNRKVHSEASLLMRGIRGPVTFSGIELPARCCSRRFGLSGPIQRRDYEVERADCKPFFNAKAQRREDARITKLHGYPVTRLNR